MGLTPLGDFSPRRQRQLATGLCLDGLIIQQALAVVKRKRYSF